MAKKKSTRKPRTQKEFLAAVPSGMRPPSWMPNPAETPKHLRLKKRHLIIEWFMRGWTLTSTTAWRKFGETRLADAVFQMKKKGFRFWPTKILKGTDRMGNKTHWGEYKLIKAKSKKAMSTYRTMQRLNGRIV